MDLDLNDSDTFNLRGENDLISFPSIDNNLNINLNNNNSSTGESQLQNNSIHNDNSDNSFINLNQIQNENQVHNSTLNNINNMNTIGTLTTGAGGSGSIGGGGGVGNLVIVNLNGNLNGSGPSINPSNNPNPNQNPNNPNNPNNLNINQTPKLIHLAQDVVSLVKTGSRALHYLSEATQTIHNNHQDNNHKNDVEEEDESLSDLEKKEKNISNATEQIKFFFEQVAYIRGHVTSWILLNEKNFEKFRDKKIFQNGGATPAEILFYYNLLRVNIAL